MEIAIISFHRSFKQTFHWWCGSNDGKECVDEHGQCKDCRIVFLRLNQGAIWNTSKQSIIEKLNKTSNEWMKTVGDDEHREQQNSWIECLFRLEHRDVGGGEEIDRRIDWTRGEWTNQFMIIIIIIVYTSFIMGQSDLKWMAPLSHFWVYTRHCPMFNHWQSLTAFTIKTHKHTQVEIVVH